jgi:hypothetical protein
MTLVSSVSDATIWSVPYDRKTFTVQATDGGPTPEIVNLFVLFKPLSNKLACLKFQRHYLECQT